MVVVTTPTGRIGYHLLNILESTTEKICVVARDPSRIPDHLKNRIKVVQGSHGDLEVVMEAFEGADDVFWVVPPNFQTKNVVDYYHDFTKPATEAMKSCGVKRVVGVSGWGREFSEMDDLIRSAVVNYRALKVPFRMELLLGQAVRIREQGAFYMSNTADRKLLTAATPDIAEAATNLLRDNSWRGQHDQPVFGPDELSPNEMAQVMTDVFGKTIRYQSVSDASYRAMLMQLYGMKEPWAQSIVDMATAQNDGIFDDVPHSQESYGLIDFHKWCEAILKPRVEQKKKAADGL